MSRRRRVAERGWVAALVCVTAACVAAGCGGADAPGVRPLGEGSRSARSATTSTPTPTGVPAGATPPSGTDSAIDGATAGDDPAAARTVQAVLDRYDRVVTGLHADPGVLLRPDDPLMAEWTAVVPPGAVLGDDVRDQVLERLRQGAAIPVRAGERSYVHHVQEVTGSDAGRLDFSWCGWSPGIVRDRATGEIVDDAVSHGVGTGTVEQLSGSWVLSALDESSYDVLPAGSPDPCPRSAGSS